MKWVLSASMRVFHLYIEIVPFWRHFKVNRALAVEAFSLRPLTDVHGSQIRYLMGGLHANPFDA